MPGTPGSTEISADESETFGGNQIELRGHVDVRRDGTQITAQNLRYDQNSDQVDAKGAVVLKDKTVLLEGSSLQMNLLSDAGTIENAHYALREKRARGKAVRIIRHLSLIH
ncbi:MAG: LPS export ABC transporter periplasmic protein LptC, partial [Gammaproteobacteria bacterium]|nr:LPS export ABC transporter periplasmic protein LptC [Gammaproteobacteria bacterium]